MPSEVITERLPTEVLTQRARSSLLMQHRRLAPPRPSRRIAPRANPRHPHLCLALAISWSTLTHTAPFSPAHLNSTPPVLLNISLRAAASSADAGSE